MKRFLLAIMALSCTLLVSRAADPLVARIKADERVYSLRPMVLDGSASTQGEGVTYLWTVKGGEAGTPPPAIDDGTDKAVAHFTPPSWGAYHIVLTVTRGAEHQETHVTIDALNDPDKDSSPTLKGAVKLLYKQAPDALKGVAKLYLHVFNPTDWKSSDKRPVVILFHGGGWVGGTPVSYAPDAMYWASRGAVGITAQYRLGIREGAQPQDCVADAKSAVRYVRAHAAELGIDPEKIAVGGGSAGAHIAACTGTVPENNDPNDDLSVSCVPNALLLYFPFQMICERRNHKEDLSPLLYVNSTTTPPTLFIAGEQDNIAPAQRGIEWGEKMKAAKNPFHLFIYRGAHHPSGVADMTKPGVGNDIIRQTDLFLTSLGFLKGEPTIPKMDTPAIEQLHVDPATFKPAASKDPAPSPAAGK